MKILVIVADRISVKSSPRYSEKPTRYFMKRLLYSIFLLGLLTIPFHAVALDLPRPHGFVNDFANVIQPAQAQKLEQILVALEQNTGIEFAITTITSLDGEAIDDIAVRLFKEWGVGKKQQDNGLLIIAAIQDRKARIEVGYGLEPIIPDSLAGRVLREVIFPEFKNGDYGEGLFNGCMVLISRIEQAKGVELPGKPSVTRRLHTEGKPAGPLTWIFRIILLGAAVILFIKHPFLFFIIFSGFGRGAGFHGGGFGRGGGFGGFGGGLSGGGGASGSW